MKDNSIDSQNEINTTTFDKKLIGLTTGFRSIPYTWRDSALYALAVGAGPKDLQYTYEKEMKAIPTFGVVPYWASLGVLPRIPRPLPAPVIAAEQVIHPTVAPLHMEHALVMHRPIDPMGGTLVYQDVITDVYDRGKGKGAVIRSKEDIYDEAGNLLCTNYSSTLFQEGGGFGGKPMPKSPIRIPEREADIIVNDHISPIQNVLYRLTGDMNLVHMDPAYAKEKGFDRVFMQGLCSFGFACRLAIDALIPGEPERMKKISAQMRSIAFPDTSIILKLWKEEDGRCLFRLLDAATDAPILDRGEFLWT
ncbi:MAG: MaoC family dehydratase N-terminal domain-containing protein [Lachnospiraceae bacterium]|nr:MaoC family dehydratase N-terminal domain-containing protein [Lachnospiraceae bacterium]